MTDEQHICAEIVPIFNHLDRDSLVKISAVTHHERVKKRDVGDEPDGSEAVSDLS